jgi:GT2 family glycosyltransferase
VIDHQNRALSITADPQASPSLDLSTPHPAVAVIVVNFNAGGLLARCVAALSAQTLTPRRTIIVDNGSTDGSLTTLARCGSGLEVIALGRNVGFAAANNAGLRHAHDCEWVALVNPDAFPTPTWLEELLRAAAAHPEFSFFASRQLLYDRPHRLDGAGDEYSVAGLAWRRGHGRPAGDLALESEEVFAPCAAAAFYHRNAVAEAGGFDESFFCFFEDVDLGFRLRLAGHRCLYVPGAVVHHVGAAMTGHRSNFSVYHGHRNLVWVFFKNMPGPLLGLYLFSHVFLNLVSIVWLTRRGQGRVALRAKHDALRDLPRIWRARRRVQASRRVASWALRQQMVRGIRALGVGRLFERLAT